MTVPTFHTGQSKDMLQQSLLPQLEALIERDLPLTTNLANISAALKTAFSWWWIGFYLVHNNELVLGPFQGPVACTRIQKGKGVCGTSWQTASSICVPDVHQFPGHIACSDASLSELVVPVLHNQQVVAVIDADSEFLNHFDQTDQDFLEKVAALIAPLFSTSHQ